MEQRLIKPKSSARAIASDVICGLLVLLFVYTACSKFFDFQKFKAQMYVQALPPQLITALIWTLPPIEIITALLLTFSRTKLIGLWVSFLLMAFFTGYAGLVLLHVFDHVPCACGGIIAGIGWKWHFAFNLFFLLLALVDIYFINRERRIIGAV